MGVLAVRANSECNHSSVFNLFEIQGKVIVMALSDTQVIVALLIALVPGVLAFRLGLELYR